MTVQGRVDTSPARHGVAAVLRYPMQSASITMLLALSFSMLLTIAPLAGILIELIVWAAAYHYAVEVFERSTNGSTVAPEFATGSTGIGWTLLILQLLFSVSGLWFDTRVETTGLRWLGIGLIACIQPAITLTTAMNRDIAAALNPLRLLQVISRLGMGYALLIAAGIALGVVQHAVIGINAASRTYVLVVVSGISAGGTQQVAGVFAGNWLLVVVGQMVSGFVLFYAIVVYFHLQGRMVFTHRDALDFTPTPETTLHPEDRHAPLMDRVDELVADADNAGAARILGACLASEPHTSPAMHVRYRQLLAKIGDETGLLAHAKARISTLLVSGDKREALALLRDALTRDPQFRAVTSEQTTQLARAAQRFGQNDLALALLQNFQLHHPYSQDIAPNALIAARLLVERHTDVAGARTLLEAAADHCVDQATLDAVLGQIAKLDALSQRLPKSESIPRS
ncbi:MAG: hypothetical protein ABIT64_00230 [Lysobacteraceae bacterium]